MNFPQASLNRATIRAERRDRRRQWYALFVGTCLALAVLVPVSMALHLAVMLPELVAQAAAQRGM